MLTTRHEAHVLLTDAARALRLERPGMSMADAFELVSLRAPDTARVLRSDLDAREARGHEPDRGCAARISDDLGDRVRSYVRDANGRTNPDKLRRLAEANGTWKPDYFDKSLGSQMAGLLGRVRALAAKGREVTFP